MVTSEDADTTWFVFAAYIAVFLPWTAVTATDFISDRWKTVKNSIRDGWYQIFFVVVPTGYVVFYIYLQSVGGDYKEVAAAIVGLVFSLQHLLRTAWGLWQLIEFRQWAIRAIDAMKVMGHPYVLRRKDGTTLSSADHSSAAIVDQIRVNETVADNLLFHGKTKCYLIYGSGPSDENAYDFRLRRNKEDGDRFLQLIIARSEFALFVLFFPLIWVIDKMIISVFKGKHRQRPYRLHQVPHNGVKVWINWAVVFAAQGLEDWVKDFVVFEDPENSSSQDIGRLFEARRDYFATEVLASAALHIEGSGNTGEIMTSPLLWTEWDPSSDVCDGRITKKELLQKAVSAGLCLPFRAPHEDQLRRGIPTSNQQKQPSPERSAEKSETGRKLASILSRLKLGSSEGDLSDTFQLPQFCGYGPFANKLEQAVGDLPVKFGDHMNMFDVERLEWLTILLHLGCLGNDRYVKQADGEGKLDDKPRTAKLDESDLALENLMTQLGLDGDKASESYQALGKFELIAFPSIVNEVLQVSDSNRLVLKVGELIDIWLSLVAGQQISHALQVAEEWENGRLEDWRPVANQNSTASKLGNVEGPARRTNEKLRHLQTDIESFRLKLQYANSSQRYWHMEQTLSFMGYDMEFVRTDLANWAQQHSAAEGEWEPRIAFNGDNSLACSPVEVGPLSGTLSSTILLAKNSALTLKRRSVRVRLIWELKRLLQRKVLEDGGGPSSMAVMMLCILAFPSVSVADESQKVTSTEQQVEKDGDVLLNIDQENVKPNSTDRQTPFESSRLYFNATAAPQRLSISVCLTSNSERTLVFATAALARHDADVSSDTFVWECWRDAFLSRLQGTIQWQALHELPTSEINDTECGIASGCQSLAVAGKGTGTKFRIWLGWEPFRAEICKFESQSPQFIMQYVAGKETKHSFSTTDGIIVRESIAVTEPKPVTYERARAENLRHACLVIREAVQDLSFEHEVEDSVLNREERISLLLEDSKKAKSEGRKAFLLELAMDLGSPLALEAFINLRCNPKSTRKVITSAVKVMKRFVANIVGDLQAEETKKVIGEGVLRQVMVTLDTVEKMRDKIGTGEPCSKLSKERLKKKLENMIELVTSAQNAWGAKERADCTSREASGEIAEVHEMFSRLARNMFYNPLVMELYVVWVTMMNLCRIDVCKGTSSAFLRQSLMRSRNPRLCYELSRLAFTQEDESHRLLWRKVLLERAVNESSSPQAMNDLAVMFQYGAGGVRKDVAKAFELYDRAYEEAGHAEAMCHLGILLSSEEHGTEKDISKAKQLLEQALSAGNTDARIPLAQLLERGGDGVDRDVERATALRREADDEIAVSTDNERLRRMRFLLARLYEVGEDLQL